MGHRLMGPWSTPPPSLCLSLQYQGSKFSDLSLISDFFPTLRTILEISVNMKRNYFWRGGGRGIGVQWAKIALECTVCDHRSQEDSSGGPPDPPERGCFNHGSFNKHLPCIHWRARHYALSDFLDKTHFDPWIFTLFHSQCLCICVLFSILCTLSWFVKTNPVITVLFSEPISYRHVSTKTHKSRPWMVWNCRR